MLTARLRVLAAWGEAEQEPAGPHRVQGCSFHACSTWDRAQNRVGAAGGCPQRARALRRAVCPLLTQHRMSFYT